jgi:hypothetical protein
MTPVTGVAGYERLPRDWSRGRAGAAERFAINRADESAVVERAIGSPWRKVVERVF